MGIVALTALPVLQRHNKVMRLSLACCGLDLGVGCRWASVTDVGRNRAVQQGCILCDHRDVPTQGFLCHAGDILPVDNNAALFEVKKAQQQVDER